LIVKTHRRQKIEQLVAFLRHEHAQTKPDSTFTLSVISGTSFLAFTRFSDSAANALIGVVWLFH
jgi:uncharacterized lipoprotein YddW (UPF0748 family)